VKEHSIYEHIRDGRLVAVSQGGEVPEFKEQREKGKRKRTPLPGLAAKPFQS